MDIIFVVWFSTFIEFKNSELFIFCSNGMVIKLTEKDILQLDHLRMNLKRQRTALINFIKLKNSLVHSIFLCKKEIGFLSMSFNRKDFSLQNLCNVFWQEPGTSYFAKKACDRVIPLFVIVIHHSLLGIVSKWVKKANVLYESDWKEKLM